MDRMKMEFRVGTGDHDTISFAEDVIVYVLRMNGKDPIIETFWTNGKPFIIDITTFGSSESDGHETDTIRLEEGFVIGVEHVDGIDRLVITDTDKNTKYIPMDLPTSHYMLNRFINRVIDYNESLRNKIALVNARALHVASEIYQDNIVKGGLSNDAVE